MCVLRQPFGILDMDADFSSFERRPQKRVEEYFPGVDSVEWEPAFSFTGRLGNPFWKFVSGISRAYSPLTQDLDDYVYLAVLRYFFISHS